MQMGPLWSLAELEFTLLKINFQIFKKAFPYLMTFRNFKQQATLFECELHKLMCLKTIDENFARSISEPDFMFEFIIFDEVDYGCRCRFIPRLSPPPLDQSQTIVFDYVQSTVVRLSVFRIVQ